MNAGLLCGTGRRRSKPSRRGHVIDKARSTSSTTATFSPILDLPGLAVAGYCYPGEQIEVRLDVPYWFCDTAGGQLDFSITDENNTTCDEGYSTGGVANKAQQGFVIDLITTPGPFFRKARAAKVGATGTNFTVLGAATGEGQIKATVD